MNEDWLRLQFRVDASYFDSLSDVLETCLALSVSIENDGEDEFFEVAFPEQPTWKKICVSALFYADVDSQAVIDFVNETLFQDHPAPVVVERFHDQDWERVWLDQYQPLQITNDLWIVPSWLEVPDPSAVNVKIDPGLAFGTGTHATTFLCLEWIGNQAIFDKNTVLDYGGGSGILAITALLKGCQSAVAVDIDPLAVSAASENAVLNQVSDQFESRNSLDFQPMEKFDVVIANILAEVLIDKAAFLVRQLAKNGILLLSGILISQRHSVEQAFLNESEFAISAKEKDNWLILILEKL